MFRLPVWEGRRYSVNPREAWALGKRTLWVIAPAREDGTADAYATGGIVKRYGGDTPEVIVLGDSHALMWSGTIDRVAEELGRTVSFYGADGISPFMDIPVKKSYPGGNGFTSDQKYIFDVKRLDSLTKWRPKLVVIGARWDVFREDESIALMEFLQHLGSEVILIEQPPILDLGERNPLHYLSDLKLYPEDGRRRYIPASASPAYQSGRALIRSLCRKFPHCHLLETSDLFFADGTSAWALEGAEALYFDDDHLCQYGAEKAKARILDTFQSLFSRDFERVTTD
jgi:hypothetical protein